MQGSSNDCLVQKHVKPYPFAFITALKKKFGIGGYSETCKKARELEKDKHQVINLHEFNINLNKRQTFSQFNEKMDFIRPLKAPDLRISPKALDYSVRESSSLSEASVNKFDMLSKDYIQNEGKAAKTLERVQRKLDFSSSNVSLLNDENDEFLKIPDLSISPSVVKKKYYLRDNSREKENGTKRIKKDDSINSKDDNFSQNISKRVKNMEYVSRKEDVSASVVKKIRNECFRYKLPRETNFGLKKQKAKNSATFSMKKDEVRRHRYSNTQHSKPVRYKSLELKGRTFSNDSINLSERNTNLQDKASATESDLLEEVETASSSYSSFTKHQMYSESCEIPSPVSKVKEVEKSVRNLVHQSNQPFIHRDLEKEVFPVQSNTKTEDSTLHSVTSDRIQGIINAESKSSTGTSFSEMLLDPRTISFRDDSYSQQEEFSNLITPDINLMLRSKRRKQFLPENSEEDNYNCVKNKPTVMADNKGGGIQLLHPTALHMQFQAELNLLDSFNESLRQVMDVESSIYNAKHAEERKLLQKEKMSSEEVKKQLVLLQSEKEVKLDNIEPIFTDPEFHGEGTCLLVAKPCEGSKLTKKSSIVSQEDFLSPVTLIRNPCEKMDDHANNRFKSLVKVAEVQTQTANDIATQTDVEFCQSRILSRLEELSGITYQRGTSNTWDIPRLSLESLGQDGDVGQVDDISLTNKMRGMSEISLHETTSSIKTETGTEISISTRDVTCSFNKDLALEMAQLIQDEKQRYDKIKMLFKSREKTLNDRTKKLVKLEEQKRQLRDTGQDSRISSVKKKQRALLLKLQQEKDEMHRLKELHKIASQERKLMLQKQRDMFNPEMSTKNILTKLKRSADSQSPRRLSGPMKGYDIRSNSSMSSLVDSDKSQIDRSQVGVKLQVFENGSRKDNKQYLRMDFDALTSEKSGSSKFVTINDGKGSVPTNFCNPNMIKAVKKSKYDIRSRKFEEKMPRADVLRQIELHSQLRQGSVVDLPGQNQERENFCLPPMYPTDDTDYITPEKIQKPPAIDELLQINCKGTKKVENPLLIEKNDLKKFQYVSDIKSGSKRKGSKIHKTKSTSDVLMTNFLRSKGDSQIWEEVLGQHNKRSKLEEEQSDDYYQNSVLEELDFNGSQSSLRALLKHSKEVKDKNDQLLRDMASNHEAKENIKAVKTLDKKGGQLENFSQVEDKDSPNVGNISTRSQVSTLTISHHSSGDSEKKYSRSVVIRSQNHRFKTSKKLEQILNAREAALASRRTCVEEWIAWHTRLREEENRVARMEQAAYKLVNAASKALSYHDTTVSSDASDVEERIGLLAQKLAGRRTKMAQLKKEAKKQAKQRLRAMETSLLNQIKKYDVTIHEMRKTLGTRKESVKNNMNAAMDSKPVTDFKVPEIPIKRIHEIYKSSDLLQSISTSDLFKNNTREKESVSTNLFKRTCDKDTVHKSQEKFESNQLIFEQDNIWNEPRRENTKFNELIEINEVNSSIWRPDSVLENSVFQETIANELKSIKSSYSQNSITSESVLSIINMPKSKIDQIPSLSNGNKITENSISKSLSMPEISKVIDTFSNRTETETDCVGEVVQIVDAENVPLSFSRKLDSIGLNRQNLNDDISTLESDLKRLSEMMLQISKKSVNKVKLRGEDKDGSSEKRTSEDISEYLPTTESIKDQSNECSLNHPGGDKGEIIQDANSINNVNNDVNDDGVRNEQNVVADMLFRTMSANDISLASFSQKIDYSARSKEMLNEIEKSIISDHIKSLEIQSHFSDQTFDEGRMRNLNKESQVFSTDLTSLEGDTKSVSEMILNASQNKNTFDASLKDIRVNERHKYFEGDTSKSKTILGISKNSTNVMREECITQGTSKIHVKKRILEDEMPTSCVSNEEIDFEKHDLLQKTMQVSDDAGERETGVYSTYVQVESLNDMSQCEDVEEHDKIEDTCIEKVCLYEDWKISDSCELQNMEEKIKGQKEGDDSSVSLVAAENKQTMNFERKGNPSIAREIISHQDNLAAEIGDTGNDLMFIPWCESTNLKTLDTNFENVELHDILNEIKRENKEDKEQTNSRRKQTINEYISSFELSSKMNQKNCKNLRITEKGGNECKSINSRDSPITVNKDAFSIPASIHSFQKTGSIIDNHNFKANIDYRANEATPLIHICLFKEKGQREKSFQKFFIPRYLTISELEADSLEGHGLIELQLKSRVLYPDDFETTSEDNSAEENILKGRVEIRECLSSFEEQDSSDGEQLDNLVEVAEDKLETLEKVSEDLSSNSEKIGENITHNAKAFSVLRNPQYEDISEESLEISLILDKTESDTPHELMPKNYEAVRKAEDVGKILDDILTKSVSKIDQLVLNFDIESQHQLSKNLCEKKAVLEQEKVSVKVESSEAVAQRITFETQLDEKKDTNDSRLDIDALDDDLLSTVSMHQNLETNADFHVKSIVTNAEQDITAMINKLKASLSQPGLEVAELDATLLRIEQLQIELEIKILEAEEVSYYVREIPNKPPPPYTPPGSCMVTASQRSPSRPRAVIPTNVDDLTAFTEKATSLIFNARECGKDITSLEAPLDIWDVSKDSETLKKDRRIYNRFLFDLCKETITEVYRLECEQPGPCWTRPSVKTKPVIKIPNNLNELTEYVNKEVGTLFGFKTKLQRENMVMRWSRKRRDRVDELLAREAQAEEDEWTKFHCDELAVKNELTVAILGSLVLDTVNVVKTVFTKRLKPRV